MIKAEQVKDGGMRIVDGGDIVDRKHPGLIGGTVDDLAVTFSVEKSGTKRRGCLRDYFLPSGQRGDTPMDERTLSLKEVEALT